MLGAHMPELPSASVLDSEKLLGARARAESLGTDRNPHFLKERMPAATGESVGSWSLKAEAWEDGWWAENERIELGSRPPDEPPPDVATP